MDQPHSVCGRWLLLALTLLAGALGSSCASLDDKRAGGGSASPVEGTPAPPGTPPIEPTVVSEPHYRDPLIAVNRVVFTFNDVTYRYLLIPLGKGYWKVVPDPVHRSVSNFFHNLRTPIYVVNDLLQLEPGPLGRHLLRFAINSTAGLLGLFDPAKAWFDLERKETSFEDTLAGYGAGYGAYLVLPIFGPSDIRNGTALVVDHFLNPIPYLTAEPETTALQAYDNFQEFAPGAEQYETLRRKLDDPYIFFRNLYLQGAQRDAAR